MTLLEQLKTITEIVRKGRNDLSRDEVLELCDIIRYIPEDNRAEVYDYLADNDPLLAQRVEKETLRWLEDIFQNMGRVGEGESPRLPKNLH